MLVLLDIDGVMVPATSWKAPQIMDDGFPEFSNRAVNSLQRILNETEASIVLTTSHKFKYSLQEWKTIFKARGISNISIKKINNKKNYFNRKQEVLDWINKKEISSGYVIIDDDKSLNSLPIDIKRKFTQTSPLVGLNEERANFAISILKSF